MIALGRGRQNKSNCPFLCVASPGVMLRVGRPPSIAAEQYPAETGINAHPDTFARALKLARITRVKQRAKGGFQSPEPVSYTHLTLPTNREV